MIMIRDDELLKLLQQDGFVRPEYGGGSIGNIPATIALLLDVPFDGLPPLHDALWRPVSGQVRRVVLIVLDALGWNLYQAMQDELGAFVGETAVFGKLTSIFPSTTVAALSTLWTGAAPGRHGLVGLRLFFPEYATAAQMLNFSPVFRKYPDALIEDGMEPETFLQTPGFAEQLAAGGIATHAFKGTEIIDSVLSKMHGRGVAGDHGIKTAADLFVQIRRLLEEKPGVPMYISGYWPTIDTLSHVHTWQGDSVKAELRSLLAMLKGELLDALSKAARKDTALFIVADHGQAVTPLEQHIVLNDHPELEKMLFMRPIGEPRVSYLYVKHGFQEAVVNYINNEIGYGLVALPNDLALSSGLFGPPPFAVDVAERLGDVVVIAKAGYVLLTDSEKKKPFQMIGRHGSMTQAEMEVPWFGFRLDD
ncbi:MAG: alkaline phosphatase family protein [Anaerolineales bacterium]|nr:alkaline phosphatase family protein [Anaerolineales bacterium]